jgi:hypothetical protein
MVVAMPSLLSALFSRGMCELRSPRCEKEKGKSSGNDHDMNRIPEGSSASIEGKSTKGLRLPKPPKT